MQPLPRQKVSLLVEQANTIMQENHDPHGFMARRILSEAQQLKVKCPCHAYLVEALIAEAQGDYAEMKKKYNTARVSAQNDEDYQQALRQHAFALGRSMWPDEATEMVMDLYSKDPLDMELLFAAESFAARSGRFDQQIPILDLILRLSADAELVEKVKGQMLLAQTVEPLLAENDATYNDMSRQVRACYDYLFEKKVKLSNAAPITCTFPKIDLECLIIDVPVKASPNDVASLNWDLCEMLTNKFPDQKPYFAFHCVAE